MTLRELLTRKSNRCLFVESVDKLWQSLGPAEDDYRQLCSATGQREKSAQLFSLVVDFVCAGILMNFSGSCLFSEVFSLFWSFTRETNILLVHFYKVTSSRGILFTG